MLAQLRQNAEAIYRGIETIPGIRLRHRPDTQGLFRAESRNLLCAGRVRMLVPSEAEESAGELLARLCCGQTPREASGQVCRLNLASRPSALARG